MTSVQSELAFELPDELAAHEPPEARGLARDDARLMVSRVGDDDITHTRFFTLPQFLSPGDVLVVNASATINAALDAIRETPVGEEKVMLHLSTPLSDTKWVVELRRTSAKGSVPLLDADIGDLLRLPAGASARLVEPYARDASFNGDRIRLWVADLDLPDDALAYTARYGSPIRYAYVQQRWPLSYYQTVFASEPGSAEMPSAGRAFTHEILARLVRKGVRVTPLVLHTGVSSLDAGEPPYPERYRVPAETARVVNEAQAAGNRIVAVGTTVVRALETVASPDGHVWPGDGWTDLVITPARGLRVVNAMLTGLHAPNASHLEMLEALTGRPHLEKTYDAALEHRYLWHEFGDLHLILAD